MAFFRSSPIPSVVRQSKLADRLPQSELRSLSQVATLIDIPEGKRIIAESTPGRECFIVVDGAFDVHNDTVAATIESGEVAGELALLTGRRRNASVDAATDAAVYALHPREFATLLSEAPQFCSQVVTAASRRLQGAEVSLPAQFVRKAEQHGGDVWSQRLASAPEWQRDD